MIKRLQVSNMHMNGDRRKLKQAVGGIVGNAIKCSPSGGKIEIVSEIDENGDFKFITYLKSANLIASRASLGSLLGTVTSKVESEYPEISLAKRFTEAHDGKFSIFNSSTSGTEITLTIPKNRLIDARKAKLQVINNN
jgi:signal transduction histidine kinase